MSGGIIPYRIMMGDLVIKGNVSMDSRHEWWNNDYYNYTYRLLHSLWLDLSIIIA